MNATAPPKVARLLLTLVLRGEEQEVILGDIDEEYATDILPRHGRRVAGRWYWRQALASIVHRCRQTTSKLWPRRNRGRDRRRTVPSHRPTAPVGPKRGSVTTAFGQDLRFAARTLRRNPGFAAVAILTVALGIGANTAVFTVVNAVLLDPLPYRAPEQLVLLWNRTVTSALERAPIAAPDVAEFRRQAELFDAFAFSNRGSEVALTGDGRPEQITMASVTSNFFTVLGVKAALGRTFAPDEGLIALGVLQDSTATIAPPPLVLSHGVWQRRFGGDATVIGRTVRINGSPGFVVGVLPERFEFLVPPDAGVARDVEAWTPIRVELSRLRRAGRLRDQDTDNTGVVVGRLSRGVTLEQARAEMDLIAARQRERDRVHRNAGTYIDVYPMHEDVVRHARPTLLALLGAVGFVLLVACLNVANLLLVRGMHREGEMAVRSALGAGQRRLTGQLLTESGLLAVLGGGAGFLVAQGGVSLLLGLKPVTLARMNDVGADWRVLAFTFGTAVVATILFGSLPALVGPRRDAGVFLRQHGAGAVRGTGSLGALVVAEVALSLVLLVGAGLMLRGFFELQRVEPGFDKEGVVAFDLGLRYPGRYQGPAARSRFVRQLEERIEALPGVTGVGAVGALPLSGRIWTQPYGLEGEAEDAWRRNEGDFRTITSGYFAAMGTRVLAGRSFTREEDLFEHHRVVIIDEAMADRIGDNPIGALVGFPLDGAPVWAEVVGVVENVRHETLWAEGRETIYVPYRQEASREIAVVVRVTGDPSTLVGSLRRVLGSMDAELPMSGVRTMQAYIADATAATRFAAALVTAFATLALILASVGLYGAISYSVAQRAREIGIKMALGASGNRLAGGIIRRGLTLTTVGLAIGLAVSFAATKVLAGLLYGVHPADLSIRGGVSVVLMAVALLACYVPARRAARVDPVDALRYG